MTCKGNAQYIFIRILNSFYNFNRNVFAKIMDGSKYARILNPRSIKIFFIFLTWGWNRKGRYILKILEL